jgi:hypothetical protein
MIPTLCARQSAEVVDSTVLARQDILPTPYTSMKGRLLKAYVFTKTLLHGCARTGHRLLKQNKASVIIEVTTERVYRFL